ncbi:MAG: putative signal transduction protein with EFhand domain [Planctomycetaceae bacterium]|nr:putative signal transduction protein with EFhand domain [Planctomycetaceae bacterium]
MKRWKISWTLCVAAALSLPGLVQGQDAKPQVGGNPEQLFKSLDKNSDGQLTADEINDDQKRFFDRLVRVGDKNTDGKLTLDEFKEAVKPDERPVDAPRGGDAGGAGRQNLDEMFKRLDKNGDGKISKDEVPEQAKPRLDPLFQRLGKDELTREDLQQAGRMAGGGPSPEETIKRMDKNGDGKITKDEVPEQAKPFLLPLFERLGKEELTKDDLQQARERMQAQFGQGRPGQGERRPNGDRPAGERAAGDRPAGERAAGDRPAEGRQGGERGEGARQNPAEMFNRLDANGDGAISLADASDQTRPMIERMLERTKKGKDGSISKDEFLAAAAFMQRDGGRGGDRGPAEARGAGERRGDAAPNDGRRPGAPGDARAAGAPGDRRGPEGGRRPALPRLFEKLDTNHDGKISADELAKAGELFKELDENQDGQLDPRELLGPPPGEGRGMRGPGGEGRGPGGGEGRGRGPAGPDAGRGARNPEGRPAAEDRPAERKPDGDKPRE